MIGTVSTQAISFLSQGRVVEDKRECRSDLPRRFLGQTMHHLDLILTLTGGLAAALVLGYLTHRLGLSPIVGYL